MSGDRRLYLLVTAVSLAVLYGSTYQQFRAFEIADPGGAADAIHYLKMARGEFESEPELRHYRWLTPAAAALIEPVTSRVVDDRDLSIRLAFYVVNFAFSAVACVVLFAFFRALRFSPLLSLVGMCAFASSRITVLVTGTPLVDAAYFCAVAVLIYLAVANHRWLARVMPVLVLSKGTILPFLLLPLLTSLRRSPTFWISLALSIALYMFGSYLIGLAYNAAALPIVSTALEHLGYVGDNARRLFTVNGLYDLQSGFSLWLPMAIVGAWLNTRHQHRAIPEVVAATVPIAFGLALLSGNLGRMFFACFPAVIAYALIAIEHVTGTDTTPA